MSDQSPEDVGNPYQAPTADLKEHSTRVFWTAEAKAGLVLLFGLLLAIIRALWLLDWILCLAIAIIILGLWIGALMANRKKRLDSK